MPGSQYRRSICIDSTAAQAGRSPDRGRCERPVSTGLLREAVPAFRRPIGVVVARQLVDEAPWFGP